MKNKLIERALAIKGSGRAASANRIAAMLSPKNMTAADGDPHNHQVASYL
ncbi:MAG: hypothetical protein WCK77_17760 [Verrucomicrobiota bacterium]